MVHQSENSAFESWQDLFIRPKEPEKLEKNVEKSEKINPLKSKLVDIDKLPKPKNGKPYCQPINLVGRLKIEPDKVLENLNSSFINIPDFVSEKMKNSRIGSIVTMIKLTPDEPLG